MAISYPLNLPEVGGLVAFTLRDRVAVGMSESPFSFAQQVFEHQGDGWLASLDFRVLEADEEAVWTAWRQSLAGPAGTFLMGPQPARTPQGSWAASPPVVNGAHAAGLKTLQVRGGGNMTWIAGDFFQLGSGSSSRLHRVVQSGSIVGSPQAGAIEIWPRLRDALSDGATITLSSPKGLWRLASRVGAWTVSPDTDYQLPTLEAVEAL